jgi:uncharacterized protein (DUF433 family)
VNVAPLGHGIYTFSEAGRLTGLSRRRVRSWFEDRNLSGKPHGRGHVFQSDYGSHGVISFLDLIEVLVAGHMRELGISLIAVRKAYAALRRYLNTQHPFSHQDLLTDGRKLFIYLEQESQNRAELLEIVSQQHAIPQVLMPYLQRVDYDRVSRLARQWNIADDIVVDPARSMGKPIVRASAMPTAVLAAAYCANGQDAERVADWYGVAPVDVEAAVRFEEHYCEAVA